MAKGDSIKGKSSSKDDAVRDQKKSSKSTATQKPPQKSSKVVVAKAVTLDDFLVTHPSFERMEDGNIRCNLTGHEMKSDLAVVQKHAQSPSYMKAEWYSADITKYEKDLIVPHKTKPKLVYCLLTSQELNRIPSHIDAHIKGGAYRRALVLHQEKEKKAEEAREARARKAELRKKWNEEHPNGVESRRKTGELRDEDEEDEDELDQTFNTEDGGEHSDGDLSFDEGVGEDEVDDLVKDFEDQIEKEDISMPDKKTKKREPKSKKSKASSPKSVTKESVKEESPKRKKKDQDKEMIETKPKTAKKLKREESDSPKGAKSNKKQKK